LPPTKTTTEMNAITTPPTGLVLYNTSTGFLTVYDGSSWIIKDIIFVPSYSCGFTPTKTAGTGTVSSSASGNYTIGVYSSPANGDQYDLTFTSLPVNVYKTMLIFVAGVDKGIYTISYQTNSGSFTTLYNGLDLYSTSTILYQVPIFVKHTGGNLVIRVLVTGKNASSSNYLFDFGFYQASPQASTAIITAQKFSIVTSTELPTGSNEVYNSYLYPIFEVGN
jgi:hypothetical protein